MGRELNSVQALYRNRDSFYNESIGNRFVNL